MVHGHDHDKGDCKLAPAVRAAQSTLSMHSGQQDSGTRRAARDTELPEPDSGTVWGRQILHCSGTTRRAGHVGATAAEGECSRAGRPAALVVVVEDAERPPLARSHCGKASTAAASASTPTRTDGLPAMVVSSRRPGKYRLVCSPPNQTARSLHSRSPATAPVQRAGHSEQAANGSGRPRVLLALAGSLAPLPAGHDGSPTKAVADGVHRLGPMPIPLLFTPSGVEPLPQRVLTGCCSSAALDSGKASAGSAPKPATQGSRTPRLHGRSSTTQRSGRANLAGPPEMADGTSGFFSPSARESPFFARPPRCHHGPKLP
ncbi:hypothetical protein FB567DRAFT_553864 [Paraphoma chrysanthemicola]|uniref:Uncharacterized protein n=1 Tax=Paraphoma chrysanthemicola TaxID=798071 RepID=A0A8K0VT64_9PLEO|nr:hypothetical protein FB567DRAFT_553864 [Paraphoma chrysanthemicola]